MLYGFLLVIHVIISVLLVVVVLMQSSKGGGLAGIAGGAMASNPVLGGRQAATLLHKVTIVLAVAFGLNVLLLGILSKGSTTPTSVTQQEATQEEAFPLEFLEEAAEPVGSEGGLPPVEGELPGEGAEPTTTEPGAQGGGASDEGSEPTQ